jgi:hypothetical protein
MSVNRWPLKAIVGPARSGTTWAGSLVDSSPDVIYRFEPFSRLHAVDPEVKHWLTRLRNQQVTESDLPPIYSSLCRANALTNKAPFFERKSYSLRTFGRRQMWPVARLIPPVRTLYSAAYSPRPGPPLVFKEVTFIYPLRNVIERTSVPVVYLVRHPCATVLSAMNAPVETTIFRRQLRLRELLLEHAPALADRFANVLESTDVVRRNALLWLMEVEQCVRLVRGSPRGMVMTHEQLADDAYAHAQALFAHLEIAYGQQTIDYIDRLYHVSASGRRGPKRTGWGNKYYSVYRNPREEKDAWKRKLSSEDRAKVETIVQGHEAIEYCAALGQWW